MTLQASWNPPEFKQSEVQQGLERLGKDLKMAIRVRFSDPARRQRMCLMVTREARCAETILSSVQKGDSRPTPVW